MPGIEGMEPHASVVILSAKRAEQAEHSPNYPRSRISAQDLGNPAPPYQWPATSIRSQTARSTVQTEPNLQLPPLGHSQSRPLEELPLRKPRSEITRLIDHLSPLRGRNPRRKSHILLSIKSATARVIVLLFLLLLPRFPLPFILGRDIFPLGLLDRLVRTYSQPTMPTTNPPTNKQSKRK